MSYWDVVSRATGHWPLDDSEQSTTVAASAGPAGTLVGGSTTDQLSTAGPTSWLPNAFRLDGVNDYISTPIAGGNLGQATICLWARPTVLQTTYTGIVCRRGRVTLYAQPTGVLSYNWQNQPDEFNHVGPTYTVGSWRHYVLRVQSSRADFFVDGVLANSKVKPHATINQEEPLLIGFDTGHPTRNFEGDLAGVQFFTEVLSDADVAELVAGPEPTASIGPYFGGPVALGLSAPIAPGDWDSHGNGAAVVTWRLQRSDDGVTGWQDVPGSVDQTEWPITDELGGDYLRVAASATNLGGQSAEVVSTSRFVEARGRPATAELGVVRASGALVGGAVSPAGAETGLVVPGEAIAAA